MTAEVATAHSADGMARSSADDLPEYLLEFHNALVKTAPPSGPIAPPSSASALAELHGPSVLVPCGQSARESHAIAAAVACPDRFWIAAPPATRESLLPILVEELLRRGERILVLTATAAAANSLVERFRDADVVRMLAPDESPEQFSAAVGPTTSVSRVRARLNEDRSGLNETIRKTQARLDAQSRAVEIRNRLAAIACPGPARAPDADPKQDRALLAAELADLRREQDGLKQLVAAKKSGNVFSKDYWKATFHAEKIRKAQELESRIQFLEREIAVSDDTPVPARCSWVSGEFDQLCTELMALGLTPPADTTAAALETACRADEADRREAEAELATAQRLLLDLESDAAARGVEYLSRVSLVVGPRDVWGEPAIERGTFDRLILEGAESVTRTEWTKMTAANDRTILLGEFPPREDFANEVWKSEHRPLWQRDAGRLVARLASVAEESTREPLADQPEVELRFGHDDRGEFVVAAVAFPPDATVAGAKAFLAAELDETQIVPLGPARWNADDLTVAWPLLESDDAVWIDLAPGVRERVVSVDGLPATAAVRFDAALWTFDSARDWVEAKSLAARSRRTVELDEA